MSRTTSRRAAFGVFAAAAVVPAGINLAKPGAGNSPDAALLAIAPTLLPLLERAEAMAPAISALHDEALSTRDQIAQERGWSEAQVEFLRLLEKNGYKHLWDSRQDLLECAETIMMPFILGAPQTIEGLLLKARYAAAMGLDWVTRDDIAALLKQRWGVVIEG